MATIDNNNGVGIDKFTQQQTKMQEVVNKGNKNLTKRALKRKKERELAKKLDNEKKKLEKEQTETLKKLKKLNKTAKNQDIKTNITIGDDNDNENGNNISATNIGSSNSDTDSYTDSDNDDDTSSSNEVDSGPRITEITSDDEDEKQSDKTEEKKEEVTAEKTRAFTKDELRAQSQLKQQLLESVMNRMTAKERLDIKLKEARNKRNRKAKK